MFACLDVKGWKWGLRGLGKGTKNGAVDSQHGAARVEVPFFILRATIPSKKASFLHLYTPLMLKNTYILSSAG